MKKASFILMALALVAMLFTGCTTQQIVSGSTFTVKDSFTNSDGEIEEILTSEVFFVFAKDGTGTMKATNTYGSSEDFSTCNNYMNFKWLTDDSACTVTRPFAENCG